MSTTPKNPVSPAPLLMGWVLSGAVACCAAALAHAATSQSAQAPLAPMQDPRLLTPTETDGRLPSQPSTAQTDGGERLAPLNTADVAQLLAGGTAAFELRSGESLRSGLTRWTSDAGWELVYPPSVKEVTITVPIAFPAGTKFEDAVRDTMRAIWVQHARTADRNEKTLKASLYRNRVLVIEEASL